MSNSVSDGVRVSDTSANPAPLGLLGFGMTTILLNLHNAGFYPLNVMIMGMGLFVGGLAQVIAGVLESRKGNTFGMTAFTAYGFFWISLVTIWLLPKTGAAAADQFAMGWYLVMWGVFTLGMFIGTLRINRALQVVFSTLTVLFALLAIENFLIGFGTVGTDIGLLDGGKTVGLGAGWVGLVCGLSAVYASLAQVINEVWGRILLPLGNNKK